MWGLEFFPGFSYDVFRLEQAGGGGGGLLPDLDLMCSVRVQPCRSCLFDLSHRWPLLWALKQHVM